MDEQKFSYIVEGEVLFLTLRPGGGWSLTSQTQAGIGVIRKHRWAPLLMADRFCLCCVEDIENGVSSEMLHPFAAKKWMGKDQSFEFTFNESRSGMFTFKEDRLEELPNNMLSQSIFNNMCSLFRGERSYGDLTQSLYKANIYPDPTILFSAGPLTYYTLEDVLDGDQTLYDQVVKTVQGIQV